MAESSKLWIFGIIIVIVLLIISMFLAGLITLFIGGAETGPIGGSVAIIPVKGAIVADSAGGIFGIQEAVSTDIVEMIEKADKNQLIQAIVFEINSPGGSAVASEEIVNAISKTEKPTVAWVREVGASGGYWVASAADHIVASRMSIVGSIGVVSSYLEFEGLMEKYGVKYRRLVAGEYKDIGSPFKEMTNEENKLLQKRLDEMHYYFIDSIVKNRNLADNEKQEISKASIYTGTEALQLGLIDEIGSLDEVTAYLERERNIKAEYTEYVKKRTFLESLGQVFSSFSFNVGKGIGEGMFNTENDLKVYS